MEVSAILKASMLTVLLFGGSFAQAQNCGDPFDVGVGPWDYADPVNHSKGSTTGNKFKSKVHLVESVHFTADVRNLIKGATGREIMPDLAYTLGKFPNHYPALFSLIKFDKQHKGQLPQLKNKAFTQSVNCYFERAFKFKPKDGQLYYLYGIYFHMNQQYDQAISQYKIAERLISSPELDYNIGLSYFESGNLELAADYANKAYSQNFQLPGLKRKLKSKGVEIN